MDWKLTVIQISGYSNKVLREDDGDNSHGIIDRASQRKGHISSRR